MKHSFTQVRYPINGSYEKYTNKNDPLASLILEKWFLFKNHPKIKELKCTKPKEIINYDIQYQIITIKYTIKLFGMNIFSYKVQNLVKNQTFTFKDDDLKDYRNEFEDYYNGYLDKENQLDQLHEHLQKMKK